MWTYNVVRSTNLAKTDREECEKIKLPTSSYQNAKIKTDKRNAYRVLMGKAPKSVSLRILRRRHKKQ